ncbi:MAG: hypothetical protein JNL98_04260 [Bryobacterales bacterium]|nr:hypothetical protein [Bryobacterales bacterium]
MLDRALEAGYLVSESRKPAPAGLIRDVTLATALWRRLRYRELNLSLLRASTPDWKPFAGPRSGDVFFAGGNQYSYQSE